MKASLLACALAAIGVFLLAIAGPAYRVGVPLAAAMTLLEWAAYVGAASVLVAAAVAAYHWRRGMRGAAAVAGAGVVLGLVALLVPASIQRQARSVPPIHDVSTDLENPPAFAAIVPLRAEASNGLDRPVEVTEQQRTAYPDLAPVTLAMPVAAAFGRALAVAQQSGWEIVAADVGAGRIEATDTTRWFGFKDDVVVRLVPWGTGTRVDVRSVSRVGESDSGSNAARVRAYLQAIQRP